MRYAYITPKGSYAPPISETVVKARRELVSAIQGGLQPKIDKAAERLENADRVARACRASQHHLRAVTQRLGKPDPVWERLVGAVAGFRKP
jgi:hypothetical protein